MRNNQNKETGKNGSEALHVGRPNVIAPGSTPEEALQQIYDRLIETLDHPAITGELKEMRFMYLSMSTAVTSHYREFIEKRVRKNSDYQECLLRLGELNFLAGRFSTHVETICNLADNLPKLFPFIKRSQSDNNLTFNFMENQVKEMNEKIRQIEQARIDALGKTPEETIQILMKSFENWKKDFFIEHSRDLSFDLLHDGFNAYSYLEQDAVPRSEVQNAMNTWHKAAVFFKDTGELLESLKLVYDKKTQEVTNE